VLHEDELPVDAALVRRLLEAQFPDWAALPLAALPTGGTDNAIFRLGDGLSVRLPRQPQAPGALAGEAEWLPRLAPHLPVAVPTPVALGAPGEGYPSEWAIHEWLDGDDASGAPLDLRRAAVDLAGVLLALRSIDPAGGPGPAGRGGPLAQRDDAVREAIGALGDAVDAEAVTAAWEESLAAPAWDGPPTWIHGDIDARNLLVTDGRITGLLDWGCACVGDPACDVKAAWAVLDAETRPIFRGRLGVDDATWSRGRGWALSQALIALPYYMDTYPVIVREARRWLAEALADA
jgi:aminoglycoside phosphotransferase (APT) family kinase protein